MSRQPRQCTSCSLQIQFSRTTSGFVTPFGSAHLLGQQEPLLFIVCCLFLFFVVCGLLFAVFGFTPVERPWEAHFAYMPVSTPLRCVADLPDAPKLQKPILCPINLQQNKSECIQWGNFAFFWKVVAVLWRRMTLSTKHILAFVVTSNFSILKESLNLDEACSSRQKHRCPATNVVMTFRTLCIHARR